MIASAYDRAKNVLLTNKEKVIELAEYLLEKEVVFAEDLERIFGARPNNNQKEENKDAVNE